ncbi:MAG TPA: ROK family protein [Gaiellaceae bacterium]|nr:ROK family protein [Gaiellaceae bacterium]
MHSGPYAVGIDIGGTKIAVAAVDPDGRLERLTRLPTAATSLDDLAEAAARAADGLDVVGVGVGICELVDDGRVGSHASIAWDEEDLAEALGPVVLEADVRAAALAEARVGAGRPFPTFLYVTVGTGISHCLVVDGEPVRGAHGAAQLAGSGAVTFACPHCGERVRISAEDAASGAALARGAATEQAAETLASFIALLVNVLDPHALVVGGGLGTAAGAYWETLVRSVREHVWAEHARDLPVLQAALGADSGVVGAGLLAVRAAETEEVR